MIESKLLPLLILAGLAVACASSDPGFSDDDDDDTVWDDPTTTTSGVGGGTAAGTGGATSTATGGDASATTGAGGGGAEIQPGDLVITEIMNNPRAVLDEVGEWFEIHNATGLPLDLEGVEIVHQPGAATGHVIGAPLLIPPGGYAVLARNADPTVNGGIGADYSYGDEINLNNTADYLAVVAPDGTLIDETSWDEISGLDPDGASRSLDAGQIHADANDDDQNFCEATSAMSSDYGTPGSPNDPC